MFSDESSEVSVTEYGIQHPKLHKPRANSYTLVRLCQKCNCNFVRHVYSSKAMK